ncbi:hypothetical protein MAR_008021, partial [Mya arenaria]
LAEQDLWIPEQICLTIAEQFAAKTIHSVHLCAPKCCSILSSKETTRLLPKKFSYGFLSKKNWKAISTEIAQKTSCFHIERSKQSDLENMHLERAFSVAHFLMKQFIANLKFEPLLSEGSKQEIFETIGQTIKSEIVENVKESEAFGLLTDEVSDISVTENLSANALAIKTLIANNLKVNGIDIRKLTGFASDGAAVMVGKVNGVATQLRKDSPSLINVHCVCHRLALACTGSNQSLKYIEKVETLLRQLSLAIF